MRSCLFSFVGHTRVWCFVVRVQFAGGGKAIEIQVGRNATFTAIE